MLSSSIYSVRSHGVTIGITDLGFVRWDARHRAGWFQPNAFGARVMPIVSAVIDALELSRTAPDDEATMATYLEAIQRVSELALTLHTPDGSRVPTDSVGLQDCVALIAFAEAESDRLAAWDDDSEAWRGDDTSPFPRYQIHVVLAADDVIP